ncbi:hypothetical protein ACTQ9L_00660 [Deinococcus wulumuqiensis]|jgi:hypothetical protein|uniref:Homing endonuclease LAGLIDADG domain-containing protein n=1 Tax=Deinococcus wulumuqiensis TaxID=980427 RepID=A0A345IKD1_9DEIO|nr:hypothetical protein [Deinococcus wulumuqiensis]AXH00154.1 hypothetical protein DVJ83_11165 [Deinococcus wulumuqiensis]
MPELSVPELSDFERGLLLGILIGEGHFGGDGKQPHVTLRMHTRHQRLFETLLDMLPESKLYGPYTHGGRSYFQWMMRGQALRETLVPLLDSLPLEQTDEHAYGRYQDMKQRYGL